MKIFLSSSAVFSTVKQKVVTQFYFGMTKLDYFGQNPAGTKIFDCLPKWCIAPVLG